MKWIGIVIGGLFIVFAVFAVLYVRGTKRQAGDVATMCALPIGTPKDEVIALARKLRFLEEEQGALGKGLDISDTKITVGKVVIEPFLRSYCEFTLVDGKVSAIRPYVLD